MIGKFSLDLGQWIAKANGETDVVVRKVCFDIFSRVIIRTPVDTGRARGNWLCGINQQRSDTVERDDKTGGAATTDAQKAIDAGAVGNVIYMSNNLHYIDSLENGRVLPEGGYTGPISKQAPNGMMRLTVQEYPGIVAGAARGT